MLHHMDYLVLETPAIERLPKEPVIVEVGANTGEWTEEALHRLDPCALIAFEPQQAAHQQLTQRLSDDERVTTLLAAAGSDEGRGELYCSGDLVDVRATLYRRPDAGRMERCNIRPIDHVLGEWDVPRIDFLKIDAEGAELEVLRGAKHYLGIGIALVQFEYNDMARSAGVRWPWIHEYLASLGYEIRQARADWPLHDGAEPEWTDSDYVAWRP